MEYLLTFFFLFAAHYVDMDHLLPWRMPSPQRILLNYVIGTVGMLAPFGWKLWQAGETGLLASLCLFVATAGLAPMIAYANDGLKKLKQTAQEQTEQAELLRRLKDEPGKGQ